MNERCAEIIADYKLHEADYMDNLIFILDEKNNEIRNAIIAWKNVNVQLSDSVEINESNDWEYVWEHCRYDLKEFMNLTSLDRGDAGAMINRLRGLKLIYPDGTINNNASKVVRSITKKRLEKQTGKKVGDGE